MSDMQTDLGELAARYPGWALIPIGRCVEFLAEEIKISTVLVRSITAIQGIPTFLAFISHVAKSGFPMPHGFDTDSFVRNSAWIADETPTKFASEIQSNEFQVLHSHSVVAMWSAVESCIEDTVILLLMNDAKARTHVSNSVPKMSRAFENIDEETCRFAFRRWEQHERRTQGASLAWLAMLNAAGIEASMPADDIDSIDEIGEIRNVIMHRAGKIDARAARASPRLAPFVGTSVHIGRREYLRYYDALSKFSLSVLSAITKWHSSN